MIKILRIPEIKKQTVQNKLSAKGNGIWLIKLIASSAL